MAARNHPTDYLYASARIRAMENTLVGREKLNGLIEMKSAAEIVAALAPFGFTPAYREDGTEDTEAMLLATLGAGFRTVAEACPDRGVFAFLQYPYDCNNIKAVIKCDVRGISPESMLMDVGTIPANNVANILADGLFRELQPHMGIAVQEARETFSKTKNPQEIDLILDKACFADMAANTKGFTFGRTAVAYRADLTNLMICLRLLRMGATYPMRMTMLRALVPGGTLEESFFREAFDGGESRFTDMLAMTCYAPIFQTEGARTLSAVEKNADDLYLEFIKGAKYVPFGPEVPIGYLVGLETSVKNLRILLAGKAAGLSTETIRGRIRSSYV